MSSSRWVEQGVWHALLETLGELALTHDWQHMIDSTAAQPGSGRKRSHEATGLRLAALFLCD